MDTHLKPRTVLGALRADFVSRRSGLEGKSKTRDESRELCSGDTFEHLDPAVLEIHPSILVRNLLSPSA